MTDIVKFKVNGIEIFGDYKNRYDSYDKENFLEWLAERNDCRPEEIETEIVAIDEESENVGVFFCDECDRLEIYEYKETEKKDLANYVSYGNKENRLIQNILPDMHPWLRESFIHGGMGCICPTCMKIMED